MLGRRQGRGILYQKALAPQGCPAQPAVAASLSNLGEVACKLLPLLLVGSPGPASFWIFPYSDPLYCLMEAK